MSCFPQIYPLSSVSQVQSFLDGCVIKRVLLYRLCIWFFYPKSAFAFLLREAITCPLLHCLSLWYISVQAVFPFACQCCPDGFGAETSFTSFIRQWLLSYFFWYAMFESYARVFRSHPLFSTNFSLVYWDWPYQPWFFCSFHGRDVSSWSWEAETDET